MTGMMVFVHTSIAMLVAPPEAFYAATRLPEALKTFNIRRLLVNLANHPQHG